MVSHDYAMVVLFLAYAFTFFIMSWIVWTQTEQTARIGLTAHMVNFVAFALIHGASDLVDAYLRIPGVNVSPTGPAAAVRLSLLALSFVFLLLFGVVSLVESPAALRAIRLMGMIAGAGTAAALVALFAEGAASGSVADAERAIRLYVALPGGLLSAYALWRTGDRCGRLGMDQCRQGSFIAAAALVAYAVFAGAIATGYPQVLRLFGLPIQVYRMSAGVVLTVGLTIMLERLSIKSGGSRD